MKEPLDFPVTRLMSTRQATAYLEGIHRHFSEQGIALTDPGDLLRNYEQHSPAPKSNPTGEQGSSLAIPPSGAAAAQSEPAAPDGRSRSPAVNSYRAARGG